MLSACLTCIVSWLSNWLSTLSDSFILSALDFDAQYTTPKRVIAAILGGINHAFFAETDLILLGFFITYMFYYKYHDFPNIL